MAEDRGWRPVAFRGGGFLPAPNPLHGLLAVVGLIGLWEAAIALGWLDPIFLPPPARIVDALWRLVVSGDLWRHLSISLLRIGDGWLIGTALGLVIGIAMGLFSLARAIGMVLVSALYPVPKIALLPLLILWLGIGEAPKIATIAAGVFFPTAIGAFSGVDGVPRNLIRMAQSFGLPMRSILGKVILPAALPGIFAAFRNSIATALLLVCAAEMIGAQFGIGAFLNTAGDLMRTDDLMAALVILSLLGLGFGAVLSLLERSFLSWR